MYYQACRALLGPFRTAGQTEREAARLGRFAFRLGGRDLDFSGIAALPERAVGRDRLQGSFLPWLASQPWVMRIYEKIWQDSRDEVKKDLPGPRLTYNKTTRSPVDPSSLP